MGNRIWGKRPGLFVDNIRFYILLLAGIMSFIAAAYLRINVSSDTLFVIRLQQVYGFIALFFWYIALLATPLSSIFGKEGFMRQYLFARRALGVSAAYFALLHVLLGLFGQLGGIGNLLLLPDRFQLSLLFGGLGLLVLLTMAFTSFDKVIKWMTFQRWKWLHRLGYLAAILVFLHVWTVGTHMTYTWVRWVFFGALVLLAGLESWRTALNIRKWVKSLNQLEFLLIFISLFVVLMVFIVVLPRTVTSYHSRHSEEHASIEREH